MIAAVFSGQGSQYAGMGQALCDQSEKARQIYGEAARFLGFDLLQLSQEQLSQTIYAQPAIVVLSLAAWSCYQDLLAERPDAAMPGLDQARMTGQNQEGQHTSEQPHSGQAGPDHSVCFAGFSLGEYSALGAAGVVDLPDLLALIQERGRLMQQASMAYPGSMAAILGLTDEQVLAVLDQPEFYHRVFGVNFNAPGQVVVSGLAEAMPTCLDALKAAGARRIVPLDVSGPFHTPLMAEAAAELGRFAARIHFRQPSGTLYSNSRAAALSPGTDWPAYLAAHMCSPVRWTDEVRQMAADGVTAYCELGPGKVLAGLIRKILPGALVWSADTPETLAKAVTEMFI